MATIKVSCIQMNITQCSKEKNVEKALLMTKDAIGSGARIVVLPEVFSTGFCYKDLESVAETSPSQRVEEYPTIERLLQFSKVHDCVLIGSVVEKRMEKPDLTRYHNLGFCIESGDLAGTYRKTHLYGLEKKHFSRGENIAPIRLERNDITIGLQICFDLRFPEISRKLALAGADILVTVGGFAEPKAGQWKALAASRAIENQIPHIACNRVGTAPFASYFGKSMIINAWGNMKAEAEGDECFIIGEIDTDETKRIRGKVSLLDDRQLDLY
ncbi:nitrilase-related carbon-nitrogen hydrolase [Methanomethylovorans sp.]|mgnify:CR=1 FL=1|uniref:nitrilase-related carbon-nitrogen hydrolase n=1 Tax=Methanomethylovorans sp. TaxID=2758717 RepID=UPI002FDCC72D